MPLGVAVFLIFGALLFGAFSYGKNGVTEETSGSSGFSLIPSAYSAQSAEPVNDLADGQAVQNISSVVSPGYDNGGVNYIAEEEGTAFDSASGAVKDPGGVFVDSTSKSGIISYTVQASDTISSIAQYFGITPDTIAAANPKAGSGSLKPGETLKILPVSGVIYVTQTSDTLDSIASSFDVPVDQIILANPGTDLDSISDLDFLKSGISLIIPGGKDGVTMPLALGN